MLRKTSEIESGSQTRNGQLFCVASGGYRTTLKMASVTFVVFLLVTTSGCAQEQKESEVCESVTNILALHEAFPEGEDLEQMLSSFEALASRTSNAELRNEISKFSARGREWLELTMGVESGKDYSLSSGEDTATAFLSQRRQLEIVCASFPG